MNVKDLIRNLNSIKKKHPDIETFVFSEGDDMDNTERMVVCYALKTLVQNKTVKANDCHPKPFDGSVALLVIG